MYRCAPVSSTPSSAAAYASSFARCDFDHVVLVYPSTQTAVTASGSETARAMACAFPGPQREVLTFQNRMSARGCDAGASGIVTSTGSWWPFQATPSGHVFSAVHARE